MTDSATRAVYIGRFQPLHLGHVNAFKHVLGRADEIIVVVGSAQYSHTTRNPFTAGERITMVRLALREEKIDAERYYIIPIRDLHIHKMWVAHVVSLTPEFSVVYSNEPLTSTLFREEGIKVEPIPFFDRNTYSSTEVRRRMLHDESWRGLLPSTVADYIEEIGGVDRIRKVAQSDNPNEVKR